MPTTKAVVQPPEVSSRLQLEMASCADAEHQWNSQHQTVLLSEAEATDASLGHEYQQESDDFAEYYSPHGNHQSQWFDQMDQNGKSMEYVEQSDQYYHGSETIVAPNCGYQQRSAAAGLWTQPSNGYDEYNNVVA